MTESTSPAYDLLKKIPPELLQMDEIPLLGHPPPFPWEKVTAHFSQIFEIEELSIKPEEFQWRSEEDLFSGMGKDLISYHVNIPPHEGSLYWVMSDQDINFLMSYLLAKEEEPLVDLDPEYRKGFIQFLGVEIINAIAKSDYDKTLSPQLQKDGELPKGAMLTLDVPIALQNRTLSGRLFISPELRTALKEHYTKEAEKAAFRSTMAEKVEVTVHLEVGKTSISLNDWKEVSSGDLLILDTCSLDPGETSGSVTLTVQGSPYFRGKLKDGSIKIIER